MKVGVVCEKRYLNQEQPAGLIRALRRKGHAVAVIDPESGAFDVGNDAWLKDFHILVARGRSWALLSLLSWAESRGIRTINRRSAVSAVHNKADMSVALAGGRLPVPNTYLGPVGLLAKQVPPSDYPLILKPIFGDNCRGLKLVSGADELEAAHWPEPVALAQQYLPTDGCDLKLYGIGSQIWAVRKPSLFQPDGAGKRCGVQKITTTAALAELGRRCGTLFGLELFGVDCILGPHGPVVIEVNDFPNYTAIPSVDDRLADYVLRNLRRQND